MIGGHLDVIDRVTGDMHMVFELIKFTVNGWLQKTERLLPDEATDADTYAELEAKEVVRLLVLAAVQPSLRHCRAAFPVDSSMHTAGPKYEPCKHCSLKAGPVLQHTCLSDA
jgi:hypothetical protein